MKITIVKLIINDKSIEGRKILLRSLIFYIKKNNRKYIYFKKIEKIIFIYLCFTWECVISLLYFLDLNI